ncbi:hypothetical protein J4727_01450 [Providencia rettgeri]|uniref:Uncharacterized protein n=1 Tax=Providencia rettgeri TaxID=587 RepID=A0A939NEM4_PRORE|nr:hypothetical protein [Providencia rettgeri]
MPAPIWRGRKAGRQIIQRRSRSSRSCSRQRHDGWSVAGKDQQAKSLEQRLNDALTKISGLEQELAKAGKGGKKKEEN